jgi:hypothetical protein
MRYYQATSQPYVSQYVGSKYQPDLYLKAGAMLEDRLNQAEEANAKFQETGELTPGRFTQLSGEAEAFNQKTRQYKEQAAQAAANNSARELTDILLKSQQHLNSSQAQKIKQDFDYTQKLAPELMKEGRRIVRGDSMYNSSMNLDPSLYQTQDDNYDKQSLVWGTTVHPSEVTAALSNMEVADGVPSGTYTKNIDMTRNYFGNKFATVIDQMGPGLEKPGSMFTGLEYKKGKDYKDQELSVEPGTASANSPNPMWSQYQEQSWNEGLNNMSSLFYRNYADKLDFKQPTDKENQGQPVDRGTLLPTPIGSTPEIDQQTTVGVQSPRPIKSFDDVSKKINDDLNPIVSGQAVAAEALKGVPGAFVQNVSPKMMETLATLEFDPIQIARVFNVPEDVAVSLSEDLIQDYNTKITDQNNWEEFQTGIKNEALGEAITRGIIKKEDIDITTGDVKPDAEAIKKTNEKFPILSKTPEQMAFWGELKNLAGIPTEDPDTKIAFQNLLTNYEKERKAAEDLDGGKLLSDIKATTDGGKRRKESLALQSVYQEKAKEILKSSNEYAKEQEKHGAYGQYINILNGKTADALKIQETYNTYSPNEIGNPKGTPDGQTAGNQAVNYALGNLAQLDVYDENGIKSGGDVIEQGLKDKITNQVVALNPLPDAIVQDIYNGRWYVQARSTAQDENKKPGKVGEESKLYFIDVTKQIENATLGATPKIHPSVIQDMKLSNAVYKEIQLMHNGDVKDLGDLSKYYGFPGAEDIKLTKVNKNSYNIKVNVDGDWVNAYDVFGEKAKTYSEKELFGTVHQFLTLASEGGDANMGKSSSQDPLGIQR